VDSIAIISSNFRHKVYRDQEVRCDRLKRIDFLEQEI
jgi:hypothetical protein